MVSNFSRNKNVLFRPALKTDLSKWPKIAVFKWSFTSWQKSESANGHSFHLAVRWSEPIWSRISRECQNSPMQNIKYQLGHFGIQNIMLVTNTFTGPISVNAILGDFGNIVFNIVSHTV